MIGNLFNLRNKDTLSLSGWPDPKVNVENNKGIFPISDISRASIYTPEFALYYGGHDGLFLLVSEGIVLN